MLNLAGVTSAHFGLNIIRTAETKTLVCQHWAEKINGKSRMLKKKHLDIIQNQYHIRKTLTKEPTRVALYKEICIDNYLTVYISHYRELVCLMHGQYISLDKNL